MAVAAHYRKDIDGLRSLAVAAVLVNHGFPGLMPGGFAGVDVFFVISGYLITGILLREADRAGAINLSNFYERRARRILPALTVVLAVTFAVGMAVMTPPELRSLGRQTLASLAFGSNIESWFDSGYFSAAAARKPLLHLWSLGVEEQFYIFWPFLVGLILAKPVRTLLPLLAISLAIAIQQAGGQYATAGFFLLPSRLWELGLGAALSRVEYGGHTIQTPRWQAFASLAGFVLVVGGYAWLTEGNDYPGWKALLPVIGACLLIAAGATTWLNRTLLSSSPAVYIGKISYPLYLWHWPILAFIRILGSDLMLTQSQSRWLKALGLLASFCLAALTYHLVESRFRAPRSSGRPEPSGHWRAVGRYLMPPLLVGPFALVSLETNGMPWRIRAAIPSNASELLAESSSKNWRADQESQKSCPIEKPDGLEWCRSIGSGNDWLVVAGDSHAESLYWAISTSPITRRILLVGSPGCPQLLGVTVRWDGETKDRCAAAAAGALSVIRALDGVKTVILIDRGPMYVEGVGVGRYEPESRAHLVVNGAPSVVPADSAYLVGKLGFARAVRASRETSVLVLLDSPEPGFLPEECIVARPFGLTVPRTPCGIPRSEVDKRQQRYRNALLRVSQLEPTLQLIDAVPLLCDAQFCPVRDSSGRLLYEDDDHLSKLGAMRIAPFLEGSGSRRLQQTSRSPAPASEGPRP